LAQQLQVIQRRFQMISVTKVSFVILAVLGESIHAIFGKLPQQFLPINCCGNYNRLF